MELKDNNFEFKDTYYEYEGDNIDYDTFLEDTIYSLPPELVQKALENIEKETSSFPMGSTTEKSLDSFTEYLKSKNIETKDLSQAIDTTTVRILKSLNGIYNTSSKEESLLILNVICSSYILKGDSILERTILRNGLTLDQHMRENGAPRNIQRHVSREEMGIALANVRNIFNQSLK
jgi:hypothetical protein